MKKLFYFVVLCVILLYGCVQEKAVRIEKHNGENLYVCDYFKVSDSTTVLKLSDLVESLEVVKLDGDTNAIVRGGEMMDVSDNYMLIRSGFQHPVKLFTRNGKYLCDVGKVGRGSGEYTFVYDMQLDEERKLILLMPMDSKGLQVFDFNGKYIARVLFAGGIVPKGKFNIQGNLLTVQSLPLKGVKWIVYQQENGLVDSVSAAPFELSEPYPFNNEIYCDRYYSSVYIHYTNNPRQDTLYHYKVGANCLIPKFTVNYGNVKIPNHQYREVGDYFEITVYAPVIMEGSTVLEPDQKVLVNKKTLKANPFKFINDLMGGYDASLRAVNNGYYIENIDPVALKEKLEKVLEKGIENKAIEKRVTDLLGSIDENDNNYVFIGKLK